MYYASSELRDDKEVVLEAVKGKGIILKYVSKRLRQDKDVVIEAIKQDKKAMLFMEEYMKDLPEIREALGEEKK